MPRAISKELAHAAYENWISTRPPAIQELAKKWRPMDRIVILGEVHYLIGFGEYENDRAGLIVSRINPVEDYEGARNAVEHIGPECVDSIE